MSLRLFSVPAFRFAVHTAIGKWSKIASFGDKAKGGARLTFDADTLGEMVENAAKRNDPIAICADHLSAYVAQTGQPAPALGFFDALAVVTGGAVAKSWNGQPDPADLADGLYARLGEVTPLGADPHKGFASYKFLSPMFSDKGTDEAGNEIGYALYDVAVTNTPFQSGTAIQFHALRADDNVRCPVCQSWQPITFSGGAWKVAPHPHGGPLCKGSGRTDWTAFGKEPTTMATPESIPFKPGDWVAPAQRPNTKGQVVSIDKVARTARVKWRADGRETDENFGYLRNASSLSQPTGAARAFGANMNPDLMTKLGLAEGCSPADKMAKYGSHAMGDASPDDLKAMADDLDKDEDEKAKALAKKFRKMAADDPPATMAHEEPDGDEAPMKDKEMARMSALARRVGVTLTQGMTRAQAFAALGAASMPAADLPRLIDERVQSALKMERDKVAKDTAEKNAKDLGDRAVEAGYPKENRDALVNFAQTDFAGAEALVSPYLKAKGALRVFTRNGGPPEHDPPATRFGGPGNGLPERGNEFDKAVRARMVKDSIDYATAMDRVNAEQPHLYSRSA